MRLAILTSHPIQYYAPIFRELARRIDVKVFFANQATPQQQAAAGFDTAFAWDVDLLSGYEHQFLRNVSTMPGTQYFAGCDTPEIGAHLRSGSFDALLVTGWHLKSYLQGIAAAKRCGMPVLVRGDSHLQTPRSLAKRVAKAAAYPILLRAFDAALYVGSRSRQYFEHYGFPPHRLFYSPHCVDTGWFEARTADDAGSTLRTSLGIGVGERVVLFAGKLVDFKRPLDVVDAVSRLAAHHGASVLVAGAGALARAMRERADSRGVTLRMLGFCNQSQMPAVYAASQVLVLPSTGRETWGLVCNEALACGRPIIVSDAVGCGLDLAGDGDVGRSYPVGDAERLAQALDAVLGAPPARAKIKAVSDAHGVAAAAQGIETALAAVSRRARAA